MTDAQNKMLHAKFEEIAQHNGLTSGQVSAWFCKRILGMEPVWIGDECEDIPKSTRDLSAGDLNRLLDAVVAHAPEKATQREEAETGGSTEEEAESRPASASGQESAKVTLQDQSSVIPDPASDPDGYGRWWCERVKACNSEQEIAKFIFGEELQFSRLDDDRQKKARKFSDDWMQKMAG